MVVVQRVGCRDTVPILMFCRVLIFALGALNSMCATSLPQHTKQGKVIYSWTFFQRVSTNQLQISP